jgi:hypothetical protein
MDLGSILLILALIFAVAAFVARPLFERATKSAENTAPTSLDGLTAQRESILIELRDLDFEHSTGKMSDNEYVVQRYRLVTKGAEILQALDNAQSAVPAAVEDEIEQMIAARRKGNGGGLPQVWAVGSATGQILRPLWRKASGGLLICSTLPAVISLFIVHPHRYALGRCYSLSHCSLPPVRLPPMSPRHRATSRSPSLLPHRPASTFPPACHPLPLAQHSMPRTVPAVTA